MNKLFISFFLLFSSAACFAEPIQGNLILKFTYYDDFRTWLEGGKSLFNYSNFVDKSKVISSQTYAPNIIYHEFDSNVYAASKNFNSVPTLLNGVVYSVKNDSNNNPIVTFVAGPNDYFYAKGFDVDEVSSLKRGHSFKFVCYKFSYDGFVLRSDQCTTPYKYFDLVSTGLYKDININDFQDESVTTVKNMLDDFADKNELNRFNISCKEKSVDDIECLDWSERIFKDLHGVASKKAKLVSACYDKDPNCLEATTFAKRYNIDFEKLKKEKEEINIQRKKQERQN